MSAAPRTPNIIALDAGRVTGIAVGPRDAARAGQVAFAQISETIRKAVAR